MHINGNRGPREVGGFWAGSTFNVGCLYFGVELCGVDIGAVTECRKVTRWACGEKGRAVRKCPDAVFVPVLCIKNFRKSAKEHVGSSVFEGEYRVGPEFLLAMIVRYTAAAKLSNKLMSEADTKKVLIALYDVFNRVLNKLKNTNGFRTAEIIRMPPPVDVKIPSAT